VLVNIGAVSGETPGAEQAKRLALGGNAMHPEGVGFVPANEAGQSCQNGQQGGLAAPFLGRLNRHKLD